MQPHRLCFTALSALALSQPLFAQQRDLDAHEHGHVTWQVAVDGQSVEEIEAEYVTPAGQGAGELEPGEALPLPTS